jgi:hypothetical protein
MAHPLKNGTLFNRQRSRSFGRIGALTKSHLNIFNKLTSNTKCLFLCKYKRDGEPASQVKTTLKSLITTTPVTSGEPKKFTPTRSSLNKIHTHKPNQASLNKFNFLNFSFSIHLSTFSTQTSIYPSPEFGGGLFIGQCRPIVMRRLLSPASLRKRPAGRAYESGCRGPG